MKPAKKNIKKKHKKYLRWLWLLLISALLSFALIIVLVAVGVFGKLPSFEELENPQSNLASEIYAADQQLLGKYFRENRTNIAYNEISPYLVEALIATEDERFKDHSGVDFKGLVRAVVFAGGRGGASTLTQQLAKNLFPRERLSKIGLIIRKFKEWVIATRLERQYTKDEIIMMYLNTFDFINNAVGIKSAAAVYFNTTPDSLKIEEAAMLIGMCKNPSMFNPLRRPDTTSHRRNVVLFQMQRNTYITQEEYDSLKQLPIVLDYKIVDHKEGAATYFREVLRAELKKIFSEKDPETGKYKLSKPDGSPYNIYKDGLRVYTTIDSRMQQYAEWAVAEHLGKELQKDFFNDLKKKKNAPFDWRVSKKDIEKIMKQAMKRTVRYHVLIGKECGNCHRRGKYISKITDGGKSYFVCSAEECSDYKRLVLSEDSIMAVFNKPVKMTVFSWEGEIDTLLSPMDSIRYYKSFLQAGFMAIDPHTGFIKAWVGGISNKHFSYDHVRQGKRQVGSTFKPFVYALAMQEGDLPCDEYPNVKTCFDLPEGRTWCPKNSDGKYGGMLSLKYGLANSINTITAQVMKKYGPLAVATLAKKMGITSHLDPVPSLCLGVADLSVYELVGANAAFVNKGVWTEPIFISRVEDKNGNLIKEFSPETRDAISEETAYITLKLMKGVVDGAYNPNTGKTTGTGMRIKGSARKYAGIKYPMAGKTGTTQSNSDGWFIGLTPDLVAGVWVGAEDRSVRFARTHYGQGANMALPIYGYFINKVYVDERLKISKSDFEKPDKKIEVEINCREYWKTQKKNGFDDSNVDFTR